MLRKSLISTRTHGNRSQTTVMFMIRNYLKKKIVEYLILSLSVKFIEAEFYLTYKEAKPRIGGVDVL